MRDYIVEKYFPLYRKERNGAMKKLVAAGFMLLLMGLYIIVGTGL